METQSSEVVFITGASSGIGAAIAREYSKRGARVAIAARRADRLEDLARELGGAGRALAVECDVTRDGDCEAAVAKVIREFGRLDTVIANAGFGVIGRFEKQSIEDHRRQLETNYFGVFRTAKASLPELKKTRGRFAAVGSVNGYISLPAAAAYCASKFAVRAFCDALRFEIARDGVSVTHIAPGFVASEIRHKDSKGVLNLEKKDPVPAFLVMPTDRAAREIAWAIEKRRAERIITFHGKVAVWFARHFPGLIRIFGRFFEEK